MTWRVPLVEIDVTEEDVDAVLDTLRSGWLTTGPVTERFEVAFADYVGAEHAVAVSSGTAALHLACIAAGLGSADEVIVPSLAFVACAHAPRYLGATPVLCDVGGMEHPLLSVEDVKRRITPRTKAVIAVHMFGYPARVEALRELCDDRELVLIEDCSQAVGAGVESGPKVGTVGDLGCFSFFAKNQLAIGEGGMVTTDNEEMASRVRALRSHGMTAPTWERHRGRAEYYDITEPGFNYRLDEPRAALGLARLRRLDGDIEARREIARAYRELLTGINGIELPFDDKAVGRSSHFAFPIVLPDAQTRDAVREGLHRRGVQTTWYPATHKLSEYAASGNDVEQTADLAERHCCLPIFSTLSRERTELVTGELREALAALDSIL